MYSNNLIEHYELRYSGNNSDLLQNSYTIDKRFVNGDTQSLILKLCEFLYNCGELPEIVFGEKQLNNIDDSRLTTNETIKNCWIETENVIIDISDLKLYIKNNSLTKTAAAGSINIENLSNTGTINFFVNGDEVDLDDEEKEIMIEQCDKTSSALSCKIRLTDYKDNMRKVSCALKNECLGQRMYERSWVYLTNKKAKNQFDILVKTIKNIRKVSQAHKLHSIYVAPIIQKSLLSLPEGDFDENVVDSSIKNKYPNEFHKDLDLDHIENIIPGLKIHDHEHWQKEHNQVP